jgi:hypothetical protein
MFWTALENFSDALEMFLEPSGIVRETEIS